MDDFFGVLLVLGGIVLGLYVGVYVCFIGGIIQVIEAVRADVLIASDVAWGIARIFGTGICGGLSAFVLIVPGLGILNG
jgi:hypothetical protein